MRFLTTAASALLAISPVAAATVKRPMANLAAREAPIAPKFFIISMVCLTRESCSLSSLTM